MDKIGKFKIIEEIGKGGMGIVYKALDPHIDREVAIKVILERELAIPEVKERFYREAKSAGKLSHENITIVHEVGDLDGKPYIVMEYLKGHELANLIAQKKPIELNRKIYYAIQICRALQFAHANKIIHRDIKPENIMVLEDDKIKIMDFGIARPESSNLTQQGMIVGTLAYMSPEQIKGLPVDNRSDIFSFGILLYELLTYKKPFQGNNTTIMYKIVHEEPERINLEASAPVQDLQEILSKCLQKDSENRYSDCASIIKDLENILRGQQQDEAITNLLIEARAFFEKKRLHEAQIRCDKVLAIDPNNDEATFLRQKCSEIENQIETMIVSADQKRAEVTALKQKVTELIAQGKAALEENKNNAALDKFKAVLELDNENKEARELVVTTEQKLKDELEIERLFANGKKYFEQNNYNEALNAFNELTSIAPTHPETQKYLQKIQTQIDQSEKTKKLLSDAQSYLKKQKFDKAIDSFNKVLKIDPQNGEAANGLKKAEKSRAKVDMAVESPEPTVEKSSGKVLRFAFVVFILVVLGAAGWYYYYGIQGALSNDEYLSLASDAREQMLSLKNSAEGVNAETWAEATFTLALQAEQNAENEFESKKYAKANQLFVEAGDLFRKSSEEAKTNSASATASADLESLKNMVAKARKDMLREKSAAEKAGAPTVAKQTFNSALAKEKEGERASQAEDRDSLVASQQAFLRAKTDYKSARVTAGKLARLRRNSEAAKSQMTRTKRRVPAKEKGQNPSYRKALALESTGNKQLKAGDYNKARKSFQQAKGLYAQAITDALRRGADDAKKSMLATKARITGDRMTDPDYQQSVEIESRGNDAYASSNFTKAEEHFKRSATLYNAVLNKPQKPESRKAPEVAQNNKQEKAAIAIANALNRYKSSLENGDVQGLKTLLLLSKDQEKAWFGFFKIAKNINVQFDKKSQRIRDSNATVDLLVRMSYYNKTTNRDEKRDFSTNLVFEIIDGAWEIAATK